MCVEIDRAAADRQDVERLGPRHDPAARATARRSKPHDSRMHSVVSSTMVRPRSTAAAVSSCSSIEQEPRAFLAKLVLGQVDGREARRERVEPRMIVAGDDGDVFRAAQLVLLQRAHESDGHQVVGDEHRVRPLLQDLDAGLDSRSRSRNRRGRRDRHRRRCFQSSSASR